MPRKPTKPERGAPPTERVHVHAMLAADLMRRLDALAVKRERADTLTGTRPDRTKLIAEAIDALLRREGL